MKVFIVNTQIIPLHLFFQLGVGDFPNCRESKLERENKTGNGKIIYQYTN